MYPIFPFPDVEHIDAFFIGCVGVLRLSSFHVVLEFFDAGQLSPCVFGFLKDGLACIFDMIQAAGKNFSCGVSILSSDIGIIGEVVVQDFFCSGRFSFFACHGDNVDHVFHALPLFSDSMDRFFSFVHGGVVGKGFMGFGGGGLHVFPCLYL